MREVSYLVVLFVFIASSLQPVFGLVQPCGSGAVLVSGTENLTSFYSQLKTIYPNWTYYDSSTGEYVLNSTALPGGDLHIYLDNGAKLVIDKPLRVENTVQYPLPEPFPESKLRQVSSEELSLNVGSQVIISPCQSCTGSSVEVVGTAITVYQMEFRIKATHVNITDSIIRGVGNLVNGWTCLNPCDNLSFTGIGGCCYFGYANTSLRVQGVDTLQNVSIENIDFIVEGARSIDTVNGLGNGTFILVPYYCPSGTLVVNNIIGNYEDVLNAGVVINNRWSSSKCYVEVINGNWNGAVTLLTTDTNGNLTVRGTYVYTSSKDNIRVEGDVTLINTVLDPPSDGQLNFTDVDSDATFRINSKPNLHIYDVKGVAILANGIRTKILPNGTHIFASSGINVTKYPHIMFKVTDGSVDLVNISKYNIGKRYKFTLSSDNHEQIVTVNISGFKPNSAVNVYYIKNGKNNLLGTFYTKSSDWVKFTYNKGFSEVTLDVVYAGSVITPPQTSNDDHESEIVDRQTTSYDNTYSDTSTTQDTGTTSSSVGLAPPENNDNGITLVLIASMAVLIAVWMTSRR